MRTAPLGDHVTLLSGFAFKSSEFNDEGIGLPVIRIRDVVRGRSETYYSGEYAEKFVVQEGDTLIGMDGEFNIARWASTPALLNQRVCRVTETSGELDEDYLRRFLAVTLKEIERVTPFVTVKHLSTKVLRSIEVPLPEVSEQQRIAGILDAADALRAKRRESIAQLDALVQATFLEMFGDLDANPFEWPVAVLGEHFEVSSSKRVLKKQWQDAGVPFYRAREVAALAKGLAVKDDLFISEKLYAALATNHGVPEAGDLLVSAVGTLGACYLVVEDDRFYFKDASVLRFHACGDLDPFFVKQAFAFDHVLRQVQAGSSSTVGTFTISRARETSLYVPPIDLQNEFRRVCHRIAGIRGAAARHLAELNTLFTSLQSRAFAGTL